jgi:hypothetical protein
VVPALNTRSPILSVATSGDPTEPVIAFSLPAARDLLCATEDVSLTWPAFAALRAAAQATMRSRFRLALGALVSEARLVFTGYFLLARNAPVPAPRSLTKPGSDLHSWIRALLIHGAIILPEDWHWGPEDCQTLFAHLTCLVAPGPPQRLPASTCDIVFSAVDWLAPSSPYSAALCAFLHALRAGLPCVPTLAALAHHPLGKFSADCRIFCTPAAGQPGGLPDSCVPLCDPDDPAALTLYFSGPTLVTLCSSHSVLPQPAPGPLAGVRLLSSGQPSRFLPDYIRLKKKPTRDVMSVFMAAKKWHSGLGPLDAVAATVVEGRMVMPKPRLPLRHSRRPNHSSWDSPGSATKRQKSHSAPSSPPGLGRASSR